MASTTNTGTCISLNNVPDSVTNLPTLSYNSTGWGTVKADFINTLLLAHSILICAVQEHFQLQQNLYRLQSGISDQYELFGIPAFKSNQTISVGRPSGGIAFFYHKSLNNCATRITVPNSHRVQGLKLKCTNAESVVFINTYFPTDPGGNQIDNTVLLETLQDIKYVMDSCDPNCKIVLLGDLNTDFIRNSSFTDLVVDFTTENNLYSLWTNKFECDFTYSHTRDCNGTQRTFYSMLDHFCVSPETMDLCEEASPLHFAENMSNHDPIYLKLKCPRLPSNTSNNNPINNSKQDKPQWNRASKTQISQYQETLNALINNIYVDNPSLYCSDLHCSDENHISNLDRMWLELMESISTAAEGNIPSNSSRKQNCIPGWKEHVQPLKEDSSFWYSIWLSAGRPSSGELHNVMKHTRNKYHHAIRKVKRLESELRKSSFLSDCENGKIKNIFQNIKCQRNKNKCTSNIVDGATDEPSIADVFKTSYKNIYNTHNDKAEVEEILSGLNNSISQENTDLLDSVSPDLVKSIIKKLSAHKNDVNFSWQSDGLKYGVDALAEPLADLFKASLVHGCISKVFLLCALTPIVKNNTKSKTSSSNYRLIGISSLIIKLLDFMLLNIFHEELLPSSLQFGFLKHSSTTMCTWTLNEVTNYFTNRGSPVYICLLDMTKAFDNIKLNILFEKLSSRIPPLFLRLVMYTYIHQKCFVNWGNAKSETFSISNGVRQGAVASPLFFNVYMDQLFDNILNSGLGCRIGNFSYSILGYADDLTLLSPTVEGLQKMIMMVEKYCTDNGLRISVDADPKESKTKCIAINTAQPTISTKVYNTPVPWVSQTEHLGHLVNSDESSLHDLMQKRATFITKLHSLRQELGDQDPTVFNKLMYTYGGAFYGSNLWDLGADDSISLYSSWNKSIRTTYQLPIDSHRYVLQELCNKADLKACLLKRFSKFRTQIQNSNKPEVIHLFNLQKSDLRSTFGRNVAISNNGDVTTPEFTTPDDAVWSIDIIKELLDSIHGSLEVPGFSKQEILQLVSSLTS